MTVDTDMFQVLTWTKISSTSILEVDPNLFQRQKVGFYIKKSTREEARYNLQNITPLKPSDLCLCHVNTHYGPTMEVRQRLPLLESPGVHL